MGPGPVVVAPKQFSGGRGAALCDTFRETRFRFPLTPNTRLLALLRRFPVIATLALPGLAQAQVAVGARDTTFAAAVARLSEPGGYFDSDNLISNETSYLHVMTRLQALDVRGGWGTWLKIRCMPVQSDLIL